MRPRDCNVWRGVISAAGKERSAAELPARGVVGIAATRIHGREVVFAQQLVHDVVLVDAPRGRLGRSRLVCQRLESGFTRQAGAVLLACGVAAAVQSMLLSMPMGRKYTREFTRRGMSASDTNGRSSGGGPVVGRYLPFVEWPVRGSESHRRGRARRADPRG